MREFVKTVIEAAAKSKGAEIKITVKERGDADGKTLSSSRRGFERS